MLKIASFTLLTLLLLDIYRLYKVAQSRPSRDLDLHLFLVSSTSLQPCPATSPHLHRLLPLPYQHLVPSAASPPAQTKFNRTASATGQPRNPRSNLACHWLSANSKSTPSSSCWQCWKHRDNYTGNPGWCCRYSPALRTRQSGLGFSWVQLINVTPVRPSPYNK